MKASLRNKTYFETNPSACHNVMRPTVASMIIISAGLFAGAAGLAILAANLFPFTVRIDGRFEALNAARALARTRAFADPYFAGPTGPTAHVAPFFPAIVALISLLPWPFETALMVFAVLICAFNAAILPFASQEIFGDSRPGIYAGVLSFVSMGVCPQSDVALSALLCLCACCAIVTRARAGALLCGLAALSNPVCILPICWVAVAWKRAIPAVVGITFVCIPWIVRNWIVLGSPTPVRDNFGLELSVSNNDCAAVSNLENIVSGCFQRVHPDFSAAENAAVRSIGEVRYNRLKMHEALSWIFRNPKRFAALTLRRLVMFLFPSWREGPYSFGNWIVTCFAVLTIFLRSIPTVRTLQAAAVVSWIPYAVIQSDLRYRMLSLWIWLLLAGFALCNLSKLLRAVKQRLHCRGSLSRSTTEELG